MSKFNGDSFTLSPGVHGDRSNTPTAKKSTAGEEGGGHSFLLLATAYSLPFQQIHLSEGQASRARFAGRATDHQHNMAISTSARGASSLNQSRSHRYIGRNEFVTRKSQDGAGQNPLVNIVTPFQEYRYVGYTRSARAGVQAPYVVLKPRNDVNEHFHRAAVLRLSRYITHVTSVTRGRLVNTEVVDDE